MVGISKHCQQPPVLQLQSLLKKKIFVWHIPLYAASHLLYHPTKKHINFVHNCGPNIGNQIFLTTCMHTPIKPAPEK
jgi:hypothetical protein